MAYPRPFLRLVCSGTLYGAEAFSYSLSLIPDFASAPVVPDEVPEGIIDAVTTFHNGSRIGSQAVLRLIKLNAIGEDGRYLNDSETIYHEVDPGVAGTGNANHPPQVALAISLRTARQRGRAHAGRFYIPVGQSVAPADGRLSVADATSIAGAATTLISSINAVDPQWNVGVASSVGEGRLQPVTHVRVGRVLDTIRSRRTSLDEGYVEGAPVDL